MIQQAQSKGSRFFSCNFFRTLPLVLMGTLVFSTGPIVSASSTLQTVALSEHQVPGLPGITYGTNFHPTAFIEPRLNNSGQIVFRGGLPAGSTTGSGAAIIAGSPGSLRLVAAPSMLAPGTDTGIRFNSISSTVPLAINEQGTVAFRATLMNASGLDRGTGIWQQSEGGALEPVAISGQSLPGTTDDSTFFDLGRPQLNDAGIVVFDSGAVGPSGSYAYWTKLPNGELRLFVKNNVTMPGFGPNIVSNFLVGLTSHDAYAHATANVLRSPPPASQVAASWRGDTFDDFSLVFNAQNAGSNVAGFVDFSFGSFGKPIAQANDIGQIAALGLLRSRNAQNNLVSQNGLFVIQPNGSIRTVAVNNAQPPSTPAGSFFSDTYFAYEFNERGKAAFRTKIVMNGEFSQRLAIFAESLNGELALITAENFHPPGTPPGVYFGEDLLQTQIEGVFDTPAFNIHGQVAFLAEVQGPGITEANDIGLWGTTRAGDLILIAREGDSLEVAPGESRTIAEILFEGGVGDGLKQYNGLNDQSLVLFSARFTDGSSGLFISSALTVPEPSIAMMVLTAILIPRRPNRRKPALP